MARKLHIARPRKHPINFQVSYSREFSDGLPELLQELFQDANLLAFAMEGYVTQNWNGNIGRIRISLGKEHFFDGTVSILERVFVCGELTTTLSSMMVNLMVGYVRSSMETGFSQELKEE